MDVYRDRPIRKLPLANVVIASPCDESWDDMTGDDRVRFCKSCEKHVHDLSAMTRDEAEAFLLGAAKGEACVRLYQRADGTMLTADCPVGVRRRRARALVLSSIGVGAVALLAFTSLAFIVAFTPEPIGARSEATRERERALAAMPRSHRIETRRALVVGETYKQGAACSLPALADRAAPANTGWIIVEGAAGTTVSEGGHVIGHTKTAILLPEGTHVLRLQNGKHVWSEIVIVRSSTVATVRPRPPSEEVHRTMGMLAPRPGELML